MLRALRVLCGNMLSLEGPGYELPICYTKRDESRCSPARFNVLRVTASNSLKAISTLQAFGPSRVEGLRRLSLRPLRAQRLAKASHRLTPALHRSIMATL